MIIAEFAHVQMLTGLHEIAFPHDKWDVASFASLLGQPGVRGFIDVRGGFLLIRQVVDEAEIITIGVTHPRQGTGRALLQAGIQYCVTSGVRFLHLEVAADNLPALGLYAAFGFIEMGVRKAYYADGADALLLRLELSAAVV